MAGIGFASSFACDGERLARIATVQYVNSSDSCVELPHVGQDRDTGPMALEDGGAMFVGFAAPGGGSADSKVEPADAGEERADIQGCLSPQREAPARPTVSFRTRAARSRIAGRSRSRFSRWYSRLYAFAHSRQ